MAEIIIDPYTGDAVKVDSKNRLNTYSINVEEDKYINLNEGKCWSLYFTTTPVGAGDYFFYLKNTGTKLLSITDIRIMAASASRTFTYDFVTGTPSYTSASDITPVQRKSSSAFTPTATIKKDTDITGLTSSGTIFFEGIDIAEKVYHLRTSSNIFIGQGGAVAFKDDTGTALVTCVVSLIELDITG